MNKGFPFSTCPGSSAAVNACAPRPPHEHSLCSRGSCPPMQLFLPLVQMGMSRPRSSRQKFFTLLNRQAISTRKILGELTSVAILLTSLTLSLSQLVSDIRNSCAPNADPLQPLSYHPSGTNFYPGPNASIQNTCTCSYVMYNLMAGRFLSFFLSLFFFQYYPLTSCHVACGDCQVRLRSNSTVSRRLIDRLPLLGWFHGTRSVAHLSVLGTGLRCR